MKKGTLCHRCGFPVPLNPKPLRSKFTKETYCGDVEECDRRADNKLTLEEIEFKNQQLLKEAKCLS